MSALELNVALQEAGRTYTEIVNALLEGDRVRRYSRELDEARAAAMTRKAVNRSAREVRP
ncbi:MAG: hypothetical protein ABR961_03220 [Thermoanaerobaculaceae bacterium]|jgi:hypothetical protein